MLGLCNITIAQNNGVCDPGESLSHPDCNGVCDTGESASSVDCNGWCGPSDSSNSVDCNGWCGPSDSSNSVDCDGICDPSDHPDSPDCIPDCSPTFLILSDGEICNNSVSGSTIDADIYDGDFCGILSTRAELYEFTSAEDFNYGIDVLNAESAHYIAIFNNCNLTNPIDCNMSSISVAFDEGETYIIAVYPADQNQLSTFDICIYEPTDYTVGNIGVNTDDPQTRFDVDGGIRPGFTVNTVPGNIRWKDDLEVYNGLEWQSVTQWNHVVTDTVDMNGNVLTGLPNPIGDTDAATKAYVDSSEDGDSDSFNEIQVITQDGLELSLSDGGGIVSIADQDSDPTNEFQSLQQNGNLVTITNGSGTVDVSDDDADPNNEIQTLSKNNNTITLSQNGGSVSVEDDDSDISNELQVLSQVGPDVTLSQGGGSINVGDMDNSNEMQSISRSNSTLTLSLGGGSIDLGDVDVSNELQYLSKSNNTITLTQGGGSVSVEDDDSDSNNEIQTLSQSGAEVTLSLAGGTIDVGDMDNSNELQTISQSGNQITLSDGGGTVSIADGDDDDTNELQVLTSNNNIYTLSGNGGTIDIEDGDADASNETITTANLFGSTLQINEAGNTFNIGLSSIATRWEDNGSELYFNTANVGIGTSDPTERLDVRGTSQVRMNSTGSSPHMQLVETGSSDGARINFQNSVETDNLWTLYGKSDNTVADNYFNIFHSVTGNILQVRGNGDVGVNGAPSTDFHLYHGNSGTSDGFRIENTGGSDPWWRFYVSSSDSNLRLYSKNQGTSIIGTFDDVSGVYSSLSDLRSKENIETLHFDWEQFMSMKTYSYEYKGDHRDARSIGLMAQEVNEVYPELVTYIADHDQYVLNYSGLAVVSIKAVQEQQSRIEKLEKETEVLKNELMEIKRMLQEK